MWIYLKCQDALQDSLPAPEIMAVFWKVQYGPTDHNSKAFRFDVLDTLLAYSPTKFLGTQMGYTKLEELGPKSPFKGWRFKKRSK